MENLIFAGSSKTANEWDALYAETHPKLKGTLTPTWYYENNSCTECDLPLILCKHNPYGIHGERYQTFKAFQAQNKQVVSVQAEDDTNEASEGQETPQITASGRRRRGSVRKELTEESEKAELLKRFDAGEGATAIAFALNVHQPWVSAFLKSKGREVKKGRAKTTNDLETAEQKAEVLRRFDATLSASRAAKEMNLPVNQVLEYLRSQGRNPHRGRQAANKELVLA